MTIREEQEEIERQTLSEYATLSTNTKGRAVEEKKCDIRTDFQRDKDRILYCKAFRRLKHKTQVFISPEGDHFRTRLTHTLEVSQIARTIARSLRLNEDLTEAIALGHDLGHTPFGHIGEHVLDELFTEGFKHNEQSLRVVDVLENLNLTYETRDGIVNHSGSNLASTLEGQIVKFADRIAYVNHDIDDAKRAGLIVEEDLPEKCSKLLGTSSRERINTMVSDILSKSRNKNIISMSPEIYNAMWDLRQFMFDRVYLGSVARAEEIKASIVIRQLYFYFIDNTLEMPDEFKDMLIKSGRDRTVCDYIAGMTDRYAIKKFEELFIPGEY
ncbi:MAG: deoxyguanosinetriphosphate triphosphohydrolase [Clostridia bacterium]|nr:deoxyguanosinetriphosphate triphosphohydrolase [Clostridia bacterium]